MRLRRAMVVLASAGGNTVPAIARLVQADEDSVRQVIHRVNKMGMPWPPVGGWPSPPDQ